MKHKITLLLLGIAAGVGVHSNASATQVRVDVQNLTASGGLYFTPVWVGFHDGSFDDFDLGVAASASVEALAEEGDVSGVRSDFMAVAGGQDDVVIAPAGFPGAPVFDPGDSGSLTLDLDPMTHRYFSFGSMVIPSNDAFIGNDDPMAYEIFSATGVFTGPLDILVLGTDIWDAGTEVNDGQGAAFLALGGSSTDEGGVVSMHPGFTTADILGRTTAAGTIVDEIAGDFTLDGYQLARITISQIPEPQFMALFGVGLGLMTFLGRRRGAGTQCT
jgi:hypothetical protein